MYNPRYDPSYIKTIDKEINATSRKIRILFLESEYPDILSIALDERTGSPALRRWLNIEEYADFQTAQKHHAARRFTLVYQSHAEFGILSRDEIYKKEHFHGSPDPVTLTLGDIGESTTVNYHPQGQKKCCLSLKISRMKDGVQLDPKRTLDIQWGSGNYIHGEEKLLFLFQIDSIDPPKRNYDSCRFFYLTDASGIKEESLERMLQAFLESNEYPDAKLVLTGTTRVIPEAFSGMIQMIQLPSPSQDDIEHQLQSRLEQEMYYTEKFTPHQIKEFASALTGLTYMQLEGVYASFGIGRMHEELRDDDKRTGLEHLRNEVWNQRMLENKKDSTLNYERIEKNPGIVGVGGFMRWFNKNLADLSNPQDAIEYGTTPPRGVILAGVPGTGKSQLAKQMTYRWWLKDHNVIKIRFDIGNLSSSHYGESEAKMRRFLSRISEQQPAILFIDEVEKTFYKNKNGEKMHEVKKQQMGMLLDWLQEHQENIFTVMTANDIEILPPELIRSGRISERFFVFMPNYYELLSMLYIFLQKPASNGKFEGQFNKRILDICKTIQDYSERYGTGSDEKEDKELDDNLKQALKEGPLAASLIQLAEYGKKNNRTPFMTGADLEELVKSTLLQLRRKNVASCCNEETFMKEMLEICKKPEFTPYGQSNLNKLAQLYLDCDYKDASADPLLPRYQFQNGKFKTNADGSILGRVPDNEYDRYMQAVLIREIEEEARKRNQDQEDRDYRIKQQELQKKQLEFQEEDRAFQKEHQEFQKKHAERMQKQWNEEDADKKARKEAEETARKIQKLQLEQLRKK